MTHWLTRDRPLLFRVYLGMAALLYLGMLAHSARRGDVRFLAKLAVLPVAGVFWVAAFLLLSSSLAPGIRFVLFALLNGIVAALAVGFCFFMDEITQSAAGVFVFSLCLAGWGILLWINREGDPVRTSPRNPPDSPDEA